MDYVKQLRPLILEPSPYLGGVIRDALENTLLIPNVAQCRQGEEALAILATTRINLLIVKVDPDCRDGVALIRKIRGGLGQVPEELPIVAMTAAPTARLVAQLRDLGVNEILALPLTTKSLADRIRSVIEQPRDWIVSDTYVGPDRRRKKGIEFQGAERRDEEEDALLLSEGIAPMDSSPPK